MKNFLVFILPLLYISFMFTAAEETNGKEQNAMKMNVQVGTYTFTATLEDNDAVRELTEMMQAGPVRKPVGA